MAGADLERVVELLHSERMDEQFRLLGAATLFAELRSGVTGVHSNGTVSKGGNLRLMFCIQSLAAPLRELLDAVLHAKIRSEGWHQVHGFVFRNGFSRSKTLRDLRQLADKFRALASYVRQVDRDYSSTMHDTSTPSSYSTGVHGPVDALRARMVGRSEVLEKMVSMVLAGGGLLVLPIVGGPGIGKTRLAMALMSDHRVLMRMTSHIRVGDDRHRHAGSHIGYRLSIGGHYLIVLDDVWTDSERNCPEIGALMKILPSNGSLVVTTRTPDVVSYLGAIAKPLYLQPLEKGFSSSLVAEWISAYRGDWPAELATEAGMAIADKCGGVPILLDHARGRFRQPQGLMFWQEFTKKATSPHDMYFWRELLACIHELPHDDFWRLFLGHPGELPDGNAVLESAAVSYQHLPSDMRSCLLYCSMFPLGHDFDVEELTDLLAAEGYLPAVVTKAQRKRFLQQFLDECFYPLQEHEYGDRCIYRMHKVMHIFAQFMDSKTGSVIRADQATQLTTKDTSQSLDSIRRASLIVNPSAAPFPTSLFQCSDLGTLILLHQGSTFPPDQPRCEVTEVPQEIFQRRIQALSFRATKIKVLPNKFLEPYHVKYLNLAQTDIENIPSSISRLMFLQTLILCHCDKLQKLHPNTTKLALLQKLDLEGCFNLVELPQDLSKMMRLEFLNVTECSLLSQLPRGVSQLKNLQVLLGYIVSCADGSSMPDLQPLANLQKLSLQGLEKVSDPLDARFASLDSKINLDSLSLRWDMDDYSDDTIPANSHAVLESLRPHQRLKALEIVGYEGEKLPLWITGRPYLKSLVEIKLINLRSCELPPLGLLPFLKIAEISGAETVCSVNGNFYGGKFPSLEKLTFSYMHNLEVWEQEHWQGMFPRLRELAIIQCPKLRALHMELQSLEKLILWMNNKMLYDLKGALQGLVKTLEHISISFSEELLASSDCEGLQDLGKLTKLEICGCDELAFLPQGLQHLSSIRSMTIDNCTKLEALPDWLENLPFLQIMRLSG
nr:unnamed protein product [Digitaria exilis]